MILWSRINGVFFPFADLARPSEADVLLGHVVVWDVIFRFHVKGVAAFLLRLRHLTKFGFGSRFRIKLGDSGFRITLGRRIKIKLGRKLRVRFRSRLGTRLESELCARLESSHWNRLRSRL